ncbi:MAG: UvrD-helicase domain-containing protein [Planctomycetota bacterium]
MTRLNAAQQSAVEHTDAPLLVLAGAGSGKTRVITERIAWLIQNRAIPGEQITALTFTNKAAREMQQRVGQLLADEEQLRQLTVCTFHALGMKMIRRNPSAYGLRYGFTILDRRDGIAVINELLRAQPSRDTSLAESILNQISHIKNATNPAQSAETSVRSTADALLKDYQRYLTMCNSVDLDDLVYLPVQLMRRDETAVNYWRTRIRHLLVDEYQDTNSVQYEMVRQLSATGKNLCAVGDDDQSIYAWRGAQPENLVSLSKDFPDLKVVKLEQNYRSANRILNAANVLIKNNKRPFEKHLWSELGYGDPIDVFEADNEEHEAERVVSGILKDQFQANAPYSDFAILYRSNHQARLLEIKCREMRIPYKISGGSSFFDRGEIRDVMAYLRLLTNPDDDAALVRIINTPRRGIGPTSLERISQLASSRSRPMLSVIDDVELASQIRPPVYKALREFSVLLSRMRSRLTNQNGADIMLAVLQDIHYRNWLLETADADAAKTKWENIKVLHAWIEDAVSRSNGDQTLGDIVSELVLADLFERQKEEEQDNRVNLMTLHAAKGLEFNRVYIVGVEEDILPHHASLEDNGLAEERRLFYVGITRARQHLSLSYTKKRKRFGEWIESIPSRFLDELPQDDLNMEVSTPASEEDRQSTGRAHLASLRAGRSGSTTR